METLHSIMLASDNTGYPKPSLRGDAQQGFCWWEGDEIERVITTLLNMMKQRGPNTRAKMPVLRRLKKDSLTALAVTFL
ncbi:MAG: hypothetical protein ACQETE_00565 [Bacteroidota bacterium]